MMLSLRMTLIQRGHVEGTGQYFAVYIKYNIEGQEETFTCMYSVTTESIVLKVLEQRKAQEKETHHSTAPLFFGVAGRSHISGQK